jgi:hypothetical protein
VESDNLVGCEGIAHHVDTLSTIRGPGLVSPRSLRSDR